MIIYLNKFGVWFLALIDASECSRWNVATHNTSRGEYRCVGMVESGEFVPSALFHIDASLRVFTKQDKGV